MVHNPFQETKLLSEGEPALKEMACPENIHCGEQFVAFQVPLVLAQNRGPRRKLRETDMYHTGIPYNTVNSQIIKLSGNRHIFPVK